MRALSIGYHEVLEPGAAAGVSSDVLHYCLDCHDFCEHLEFIGQRARSGVKTITGFQRWEGETPLFLTFDDGGAGMFSCVIDELERRGWRGHFFITTDWIGRPGFLTAPQIREIHERGHVIGSHSCSHPARMSHLVWNDLKREWSVSCARLADIVGARVVVASVPDGYHSLKVAEAAAVCGIEALFTSEPTSQVRTVDHCLVLGRYTVLRGTRPALSGALAAGQVWPRWRQAMGWQAKKTVKTVTGGHYLRIRQALLTRGVFGD